MPSILHSHCAILVVALLGIFALRSCHNLEPVPSMFQVHNAEHTSDLPPNALQSFLRRYHLKYSSVQAPDSRRRLDTRARTYPNTKFRCTTCGYKHEDSYLQFTNWGLQSPAYQNRHYGYTTQIQHGDSIFVGLEDPTKRSTVKWRVRKDPSCFIYASSYYSLTALGIQIIRRLRRRETGQCLASKVSL